MRWVSTAVDPSDKIEIYEELLATNREGVVFKDMDAPYSPGRPNSGGPQLKFKFVESASFVVTIPPNHTVPEVGEVYETRYLHAYRESGSIYQPVYLGRRTDIPVTECVVEQLKYKAAI